MNPKYAIYEQIDRYLKNELSTDELLEFQEKLSHDGALKSLVEAQKIANEVIIEHEMIKLKERMSKDLNRGGTGDFFKWSKVIIASTLIVSTSVYTFVQYKNDEEKSIIVEHATISSPAVSNSNKPEDVISVNKNSENINHDDILKSTANLPDNAKRNGSEKTDVVNTESIAENKNSTVFEREINAPIVKSITNEKSNNLDSRSSSLDNISNCDNTKITAKVKVDYGFNGDQEPSIVIEKKSIHGGTPPYSYALDQGSFDTNHRFESVPEGTHHVSIKDGNNCISTLQEEINVKIPVKEVDDVFTPSHGEHWNFPIKNIDNATITIINKVGSTVYFTNILGGYPSSWNGRDNNGNELETGNYYFVIQSSNNEMIKGHISITK